MASLRPLLAALVLAGSTSGVPQEPDEPALPLAAPLDTAVDVAVERGVARLVELQELDGSWRFKQEQYPGGQTAFCAYTLLECGLGPEHQAVQRAFAYLETVEPVTVYATASLILALCAADALAHKRRIAALAEQLVDWQDGGWAYPYDNVDLSNTQFAAFGLRAAREAGAKVSFKTWQRVLDWVLDFRPSDSLGPGRSWGYEEGRKGSGSMTIGALTVLAIARDALVDDKRLAPSKLQALEAEIAAGLEWMTTHIAFEFNPMPARARDPREARWVYYYLYGIERAGALLGTRRIGGRDWYADGAQFVLGAQGENGGWTTELDDEQPNTCFALLFLRRATAPTTGSGRHSAKTYGADDPAVDLSLRASGDTPLRVWISSYGDALRQRATWPGEERLRVARVEYSTEDGSVLATVEADAAALGDGRFAAELELPGPGAHRILARAQLSVPGAGEGELEAVESPPLEVSITDVLLPWMLEYASDRGRNLLLTAEVDIEGSSVLDMSFARATNVCDGLQIRGWLCAEDDDEPRVVLDLARPLRANVLLLSHPRGEPDDPGLWARANEIEIVVNAGEPLRVTMDPDEQRKTRVELPRVVGIRRLEVRVLDRTPGREGTRATGFGEIELQLAR